MKDRTKYLTLPIFLLVTVFCFNGIQKGWAQSYPDSAFVKDNPIVARLESLAASKFFFNEGFTSDIDKLNIYNFPLDSVPVYPDSVYRARIAHLNLHSPFEFVYNDQVKAYVELYAYKRRILTARMMGLAELYYPLFEEQLDIYGIPLEMKHLAIVESALNPTARSRVGASGLWQFMYGTGKMYGMEMTSYVDERFDPYKETVAACKLMNDLYAIYHDWAIVLAAYNAGSGTVNRAIRLANLDSNETVTYWRIRSFLPLETQNYVPSFIGINYIMAYSTEHNIYPVAPEYFYENIDTLTIKKSVTFNQIASYLCIPIEQVEFLNPAYKKGFIPASPEKPYLLTLPRKAMADYMNNEAAICAYKSAEEIKLEKDMAAAAAMNNTSNGTSTANKNTQVSNTNNTQNQTKPSYTRYVYHTVQKGDSLWSIAKQYRGASVDEIRRLNGLQQNSIIHPGQKLKVGVTG